MAKKHATLLAQKSSDHSMVRIRLAGHLDMMPESPTRARRSREFATYNWSTAGVSMADPLRAPGQRTENELVSSGCRCLFRDARLVRVDHPRRDAITVDPYAVVNGYTRKSAPRHSLTWPPRWLT
jgi:hypothetical protein